MRDIQRLVATLALVVPVTGRAATFFEAFSSPGDAIGDGQHYFLSSATGAFLLVGGGAQAVVFRATTRDEFVGWEILFVPVPGGTLAPGVYDPAEDTANGDVPDIPGLDVQHVGRRCFREAGRFTIHELRLGDPNVGNGVESFAADFEVRCSDSRSALRGAIRYRAGDASCTGMPDGTPCDDSNPCSGDDRCLAGECAGLDPPACDDGNALTADSCVLPDGCVHTPVGSTWAVHGVATASATARGHTTTRRQPFDGFLALSADNGYRVPDDGTSCAVPERVDEIGRWRVGRRKRLELQPTNLAEIGRHAVDCNGDIDSFRITRVREWVKVGGPGRLCAWDRAVRNQLHVCGASVVRVRAVVQGIPVTSVGVEHFSGTRADTGDFLPPLVH